MDDEDDFTACYQRPSRLLRWQNVAAVLLSGFGGCVGEVASTFEGVASLLMADGNYQDDRTAFHEEAALDLEMIWKGEAE